MADIIEKFPYQPHYRFAQAEGYFIEKDFRRARAEFRLVRERLLNGGAANRIARPLRRFRRVAHRAFGL